MAVSIVFETSSACAIDWPLVVDLLKALAWPIVTLASIAMLRKAILSLIPLLRRLKYKDLELEFAEEMKTTKDIARAVAPAVAEAPPSTPGGFNPLEVDLLNILEASPRAAVVEAWRRVEDAARKAINSRQAFGQLDTKSIVGANLTKLLQQAELIRGEELRVINRLRTLRNAAAHGAEYEAISESSALEYIELAVNLIRLFERRTSGGS